MDVAMHMTTLASDKVMTQVTGLHADTDSDRILRTLLGVIVIVIGLHHIINCDYTLASVTTCFPHHHHNILTNQKTALEY